MPYICKEIVPSFEDNPIGAHFTCFTSTNIQIQKNLQNLVRLTGEERECRRMPAAWRALTAQFACFTSAKVGILTAAEVRSDSVAGRGRRGARQDVHGGHDLDV